MAIDGRNIGKAPQKPDEYDSPGVRIAAGAIFWVPVALVIAFAYWSGTWIGGTVGGLLSLVSTAATIFVLWLMRKRKS